METNNGLPVSTGVTDDILDIEAIQNPTLPFNPGTPGVGDAAEAAKAIEAKKLADEEAARKAASASGSENVEIVNIDNVDYTIDAQGNALDKDKKLVYTKEQIDVFKAAATKEELGPDGKPIKKDDIPTEDPVVVEIQKGLGITINDEVGKPKQYTDDIQGITEYVKDVTETLLADQTQKFLESNPRLLAYHRHMALGGNDETFFNRIQDDWKAIKLDPKNPAQAKDVIVKSLIKKGVESGMAIQMGETMSAKDDFHETATKLLKEQVTLQEQNELAEKKKYDDAIELQKQNQINYLNELNDLVISKGQIEDVIIPVAERQAFMNYLVMPIKDGMTQDQIDRNTDPLSVDLKLAYLRYKNFNFGSIVRTIAKSQNAEGLRAKLKAAENKLKSGGGTGTYLPQSQDVNGEVLSLDEMMKS